METDWLAQYSRHAGMAVPWEFCPICEAELVVFLPWQVFGTQGYAVICSACKNIVGYDTSADLLTHAEQTFVPATWYPEDVWPGALPTKGAWWKRVLCWAIGHWWTTMPTTPRHTVRAHDWCLRCHAYRGHVPPHREVHG